MCGLICIVWCNFKSPSVSKFSVQILHLKLSVLRYTTSPKKLKCIRYKTDQQITLSRLKVVLVSKYIIKQAINCTYFFQILPYFYTRHPETPKITTHFTFIF